MSNVKITPGAKQDYDQALAWYREQSVGAALGFEQAVLDAIEKVCAFPERGAHCGGHHRYQLLKRYPFSMIYRVRAESIEITAIAHASRRPGYWAK